ncbi:copper resistance protein CopC [Psychrobacillus sp. INOP01]|uniref:copper resistance CopC family protein n=1 Tax=Psychrobacillus sp. INOP01 TaxID=2829187 RepID=UPI001BADD466|nr:copper resistance CopC family protein [Psychrobacillus sp. INOP01]QUG41823.1 copper resistance protein CopC [Psychrobacillus sp. INOP01]
MKRILWMTIACVLLFSNSALAHTGLESSTPAQGSTVTEKVNEITLTFLTKIEETSSFTLTNSSNDSIDVEGITVNDHIMTGNVIESLENGAYQINWKIIGADGHPMEGVIDFVLDAPEEVEAEEPITEPSDEVEPNESNTEELETTVEADDEEEESTNSTVGIIIVLVIIVALAAWWMARRNKK